MYDRDLLYSFCYSKLVKPALERWATHSTPLQYHRPVVIPGNSRDQLRHHLGSLVAADVSFGATDYSPIVLKESVSRSWSDVPGTDVDLEVISRKVAMERSRAAKLELTELSFLPLRFSFLSQFAHGDWILLRGQLVIW